MCVGGGGGGEGRGLVSKLINSSVGVLACVCVSLFTIQSSQKPRTLIKPK